MIPENKQPAVIKALQTAFAVSEYEDIYQLTKGLSSALIFKIIVHGNPYLLRVITRTDAMGDPAFYYNCMEVAAKYEVAPRVHYMSIEDRVSITDFINEQPFPLSTAIEDMPHLLKKVHSLPKFPFRINYFDSMEKFVQQFRAANIFPEDEIKDAYDLHDRIINVYPRNDQENWVSCHNDSKPENIIFDGHKPWFVDWEAAFLNDRYLDLAIVANFVVKNEKDEAAYLETYFDGTVTEYKLARFFLMQQLLHFYYFSFLMLIDKGNKPIDISAIDKPDFREFHDKMWDGGISLAGIETKREYALLHLEQFRLNAQTKRFTDSLHIVSNHN